MAHPHANQKKEERQEYKGDEEDLSDPEQKRKSPTKKLQQAYFDVVEPSLLNHRIQAFIMALVWGFGAPLVVSARDAFSTFIQQTVEKQFLDDCKFKFKKRIKSETFPQKAFNLFDYFYHLDLKMWL